MLQVSYIQLLNCNAYIPIFRVEDVVRKQRENDYKGENVKLSRFEALKAVSTKNVIFWDNAPCSRIEDDRRCGETSFLLVAFLPYILRQFHFTINLTFFEVIIRNCWKGP
jgi:hypothetical protein